MPHADASPQILRCTVCRSRFLAPHERCDDCGGALVTATEATPPLPFSEDLVPVAGGETLLMKALVEAFEAHGLRHHLAVDPDAPRFTNLHGVPDGYDPVKAFAGVDPYAVKSWVLRVRPEDEGAARQLVAAHDDWMDDAYVAGVLAAGERSQASGWTRARLGRITATLLGIGALGPLVRDRLPDREMQDLLDGVLLTAFWIGLLLAVAWVGLEVGRWNRARMRHAAGDGRAVDDGDV